jgi:hypothetical protein
VAKASLCDLLERDLESVRIYEHDDGSSRLDLAMVPFQVVTVKLVLSGGDKGEDEYELVSVSSGEE